jgi:hypothetical protein
MAIHEFNVIAQDAARARQGDAKEHVIGDEVRDVVALVGGSRDLSPRYVSTLGHSKEEREQRKRKRIVETDGDLSESDVAEADVHVFDRVHRRTARAQQQRVDFIHVIAPIHRIAGDQAHGRGACSENLLETSVVILRGAEANELALAPGPSAVHGGIDAARARKLARKTKIVEVVFAAPVVGPVERLHFDPRAIADRCVVGEPGANTPRANRLPTGRTDTSAG